MLPWVNRGLQSLSMGDRVYGLAQADLCIARNLSDRGVGAPLSKRGAPTVDTLIEPLRVYADLRHVRSFVRPHKAVPAASFGLDVLRTTRSAQLGAQAAHEYFQVFGARHVVATPHTVQQGLMRQEVPGVADQVVEQLVLHRRQFDGLTLDRHFLIFEIDRPPRSQAAPERAPAAPPAAGQP